MPTRGEDLATRFDRAVEDLRSTIESCPDNKWGAPCADGWTVAQVAQHVAGQFPLEGEYFFAAADGRGLPAYTWDDINAKNDARAAAEQSVTKEHVLKTLRDAAPPISSWLRGLSDEQLDRASPLALADGAMVTTQQLIEGGVLIDHVAGGHLQSIKTAIA